MAGGVIHFPMNYRRGFFRAWVLLTVLWIAGVAYVSGPDIYSAFDQAALKTAVEKDPIVEPKGPVAVFDAMPLPPQPRSPWLERQHTWDPDPWGWLLRSAAVAFLPPLALLALGAMLGWVFTGFRRHA